MNTSKFIFGIHPQAASDLFGHVGGAVINPDGKIIDLMMKRVEENIMGATRSLVTKTKCLCPLMTVGIIFKRPEDPNGPLLFALHSNTRNFVQRYSIGIESEVEFEDGICHGMDGVVEQNVLDISNTLDYNIIRISEKIDVSWPEEGPDTFFAGKVGMVFGTPNKDLGSDNPHYGVIYAIEVPQGTEMELRGLANNTLGWFTAEDLCSIDLCKYSVWSEMIIHRLKDLEKAILNQEVELTVNGFSDDEDDAEWLNTANFHDGIMEPLYTPTPKEQEPPTDGDVVLDIADFSFKKWSEGYLNEIDKLPPPEHFFPSKDKLPFNLQVSSTEGSCIDTKSLSDSFGVGACLPSRVSMAIDKK